MAGDLSVLDPSDAETGEIIEAGSAAGADAVDILMRPVSKRPAHEQFKILQGWWRADADHSRKWRGNCKMWFEFRAGEHWTAEDRALLEGAGRPVIVFNRVLTILKAVAGMEINGRHETTFIPRGTEDTAPNEVLSEAARWMADECDGEDEESQAFDDCATCGMGWVEERMSYEDDPSGMYVEEEVDPLEMYWDRTSRKKNLSSARRMARVRRMAYTDALSILPGFTREQMDATWAIDSGLDYPEKSIEQKWKRDSSNTSDPDFDDLDEVTIVQMQWIEKEVYWLVADEATNRKVELTDAEYKVLEQRMKRLRMELIAVRLTRKVYKQAFLGNDGVMLKPAGSAPMGSQFSWKCITGERDAEGTWFGLVKVMRDPQMWANKWLSQILHILNSTAKGGILAEHTAFDDEREAEESYAQADEITWVADGALSTDKPKIIPKPGDGKIDGYVGLLTLAISAIPQVVGINLELLGQQDANQPGVLEAMRKQAGMTVLATLFDSLRRFRKQVGRGKLFFIQNFLSDGRLMRIAGPDGAKAVALAKEKTTGTYDVRVADTPTSPNQKEANWQIIQPMLAAFKDQLLANPLVFVTLLEYSPLPSRVVESIKTLILQQQNDPQAQERAKEDRELLVQATTAKIMKDSTSAQLNVAKAESSKAVAVFDIAMARNMVEDNLRQGKAEEALHMLEQMRAMIELKAAEDDADRKQAEAVKAVAMAERLRSQARLDDAGAVSEVIRARGEAGVALAKGRREQVGAAIDMLTGGAKARRDEAAAEKDRATARQVERTPVTADS